MPPCSFDSFMMYMKWNWALYEISYYDNATNGNRGTMASLGSDILLVSTKTHKSI